ncbi:Cof-type HAD-IIB family hydrolase [Mobilicoccus massiliensis]|uniref:Cof-type HAD-IIB family hydrolase n=2 Tax=Mobilicoccus massiliensis TaxID=1522310 RepID=UPI000AFAD1E1|nr:Cof-type HAD-IIB family hydrolase [Mobilicoccus massiliensis]
MSPAPTMPDHPVDVRLVAVDMDGTLIGPDGRVPEGFWPLLEAMTKRGIVVVPASGRQYATLRALFGEAASQMGFIAENGTLVAYRDEVLATDTLAPEAATDLIGAARAAARERDLGAVLCGVRSAWIERTDARFHDEVAIYYRRLETVDDLLAVDDEALKISVYDVDSSAQAEPFFAPFRETHQVAVSGPHWIDVMNSGVHKGAGLERLRTRLGLEREQCVAFGDYHNDLQLLDAAGYSFAMADGHPDVLARARYIAPPSAEAGVVTVLEQLLA